MPPKKKTAKPTKAQAARPGGKRARSPEPKSVPKGDRRWPNLLENELRPGQPPITMFSLSPSAGLDIQKPDAVREPAATKATHQPEAPQFTGKFDLYAMVLPFLSKVYLPPGTSSPQPAALYKTILTWQAKPDFTGRCLLPTDHSDDALLESGAICDPMEEMPFGMSIANIKDVPKMKFTTKEQSHFCSFEDVDSPGIEGSTTITDMHCGLSGAHGTFKMRRLWTGKAEGSTEVVELFEGYLSLNVRYSGLYSRKGHGSGEDHAFAFWAVRARKDARGEEIGLNAS